MHSPVHKKNRGHFQGQNKERPGNMMVADPKTMAVLGEIFGS